MPRMSALEAAFCRSAPWRVVARRLVPWATQGVPLAGSVLKVGGGGGAMAEAILAARPRLRLTTTDTDLAMVRSGQRRLARSAAQALRADAIALPVADESFDTVLSFLLLHHVIHWEQAVTEAARVLRPGGLFVGYDLLVLRAAAWLHVLDRSTARRTGSSNRPRSNRLCDTPASTRSASRGSAVVGSCGSSRTSPAPSRPDPVPTGEHAEQGRMDLASPTPAVPATPRPRHQPGTPALTGMSWCGFSPFFYGL